MYRQMEGQMEGRRDGKTDREMGDGQTDGWTDGQTDRWKAERMNCRMDTTSYRDVRTHQKSGRNINHELDDVDILTYCPHLSLINQSIPRKNDYCVFDQ